MCKVQHLAKGEVLRVGCEYSKKNWEGKRPHFKFLPYIEPERKGQARYPLHHGGRQWIILVFR